MWIKDGAVYNRHEDIRKAVGQRIGLPALLTDEILAAHGFEVVTDDGKPDATYAENIVEDPPAKIGGQWKRQWRKVPASPDEIDARTRVKTAEMMAARDQLIRDFFFAELVTPTLNQGQYRKHLDDLRDVPLQAGFPWSIDWPVKP